MSIPLDNELERVVQNPDNFIMSDDLLDRLDMSHLDSTKDLQDERKISILCTLLYEKKDSLKGNFYKFLHQEDGTSELIVEAQAHDAFFLFGRPNLIGFEIYSENDESCYVYYTINDKVSHDPKSLNFEITTSEQGNLFIHYLIPSRRIIKNSI